MATIAGLQSPITSNSAICTVMGAGGTMMDAGSIVRAMPGPARRGVGVRTCTVSHLSYVGAWHAREAQNALGPV